MKYFSVQVTFGTGLLVLLTHTVSAQWVQTNGPEGGTINAFAVSGGTIFAGTDGGGVFRSTNNGTNWIAVDSGLPGYNVNALAVSGSTIFAGTEGGLFLSTNNGTSWTVYDFINTVNIGAGLNAADVTSFAVSGSTIFAGTSALETSYYVAMGSLGVFLSVNSGISWNPINSGLPGDFCVNALAASGNAIFAGGWSDSIAPPPPGGGDGSLANYGAGIFLSTNNGTNWTAANSGLPADAWVHSFAMSGNTIFAGITILETYNTGTGGGIFSSADNGSNWNAADSGLPMDLLVSSLAVSGNTIFAGTDSGVFLSTNNGTSWKAANSGLPIGPWVSSLAVSGSNLFAGTTGDGVWRRPLSEMIEVIYNPQRVVLDQSNFKALAPSLTNPEATIEFSLPHSGQVSVTIYNLSGHEIASLVNKNLSQGSHSISWNIRNLATGCYMIRLKTGSNFYLKSFPIFR
jgi:hypothetical protein